MPWLPEVFTAPVMEQILEQRRRDALVAVPYFDGLLAGDPDPLVESFAREPEVHALPTLLEFQASRAAARTGPDGEPVLLKDQNRRRWNRMLIARGIKALHRADANSTGAPGPYDAGFKDVLDLRPSEQATVIARFGPYRGRYVLHCHNLEHEDMGMMRPFVVMPPEVLAFHHHHPGGGHDHGEH